MKFYRMAVKGERLPKSMLFLSGSTDISTEISNAKTFNSEFFKSVYATNALR